MDVQQQQRESVWSVAGAWLPWCLTLVFLLIIAWTTFVVWVEATHYRHPTISVMAIAAVGKSSPAIPLIVAASILAVSLADTLGGGLVVTKRFLEDRFLNPWLAKRKAEAKAEAERADRLDRHWRAWYGRQQAAFAKGEPFDEPPPDLDSLGEGPEYY